MRITLHQQLLLLQQDLQILIQVVKSVRMVLNMCGNVEELLQLVLMTL